MLQYLLLLCAFAVPDIRALAIPAIEATAEDRKCLDITHCRTLSNIVWSCLVTIFACTWVSIHRNLVPDSQGVISAFWDRVGITVLTILIPEITLAWAVRQWIVARQIAEEFSEIAKKFSPVLPDPTIPIDFPDLTVRVDSAAVVEPMQAMGSAEEAAINRRKFAEALADLWNYLRSRFSNDDRVWTITHGFFVLMGGFYFNGKGSEPARPASREDLEDMVSKGLLVDLPNKQDIDARSKSDAFSKTVTVLQTLWFIMQCIARAIQHLPITNLEIATLAYTTINFAMYRVWLQKPLNVSQPIRLTRPKREEPRTAGPESYRNVRSESLSNTVEAVWRAQIKTIVKAVVGTQDDNVQLWKLHQVPALYSGKPKQYQVLFADAIALAVGVIFGAVHCIAWSFAFPSQTEQLLWRISAITTVAIPFLYVMFVFLVVFEMNLLAKPTLILSTVGIPSFLVARVMLIVLTFTTLRDLPPAAYEAIHWMSFLPHV